MILRIFDTDVILSTFLTPYSLICKNIYRFFIHFLQIPLLVAIFELQNITNSVFINKIALNTQKTLTILLIEDKTIRNFWSNTLQTISFLIQSRIQYQTISPFTSPALIKSIRKSEIAIFNRSTSSNIWWIFDFSRTRNSSISGFIPGKTSHTPRILYQNIIIFSHNSIENQFLYSTVQNFSFSEAIFKTIHCFGQLLVSLYLIRLLIFTRNGIRSIKVLFSIRSNINNITH